MNQDSKILVIIGVITLVVITVAVLFLGRSSTPPASPAVKIDPQILVRDDSFRIASDSAKVTIVEFADFQCPACANAHPDVKQALAAYQGQVTYVFRHFPLPQHQNALIAAEAAEAAGEQGKFWEMQDVLYEKQAEWSPVANPLPLLVGYAQNLGLDKDKFEQRVKANAFREKIQRDLRDGQTAGVNSTPSFFINGEKLQTVPSFSEFKNRIDSLLNT